jgi:hypothetical protein
MITLQKEQENLLKISLGIKSLSTSLPVGIEIVPPFSLQIRLKLYRSASGWYNLNAHR